MAGIGRSKLDGSSLGTWDSPARRLVLSILQSLVVFVADDSTGGIHLTAEPRGAEGEVATVFGLRVGGSKKGNSTTLPDAGRGELRPLTRNQDDPVLNVNGESIIGWRRADDNSGRRPTRNSIALG